MESNKSLVSRTTSSLITFFALYFTTLFSLDAWATARGSPYRAPGTTTFARPDNRAPEAGSYQARMHGRGNAGPESGSGGGFASRDVGRMDSRPPVRMGGTASCGACMY